MSNDSDVHVLDIYAKQVPPWRYKIASADRIKQIMVTTWGGLGDQVVAAAVMAYLFELFHGFEISLLSSFGELFSHLPFKRIYHKSESPKLNDKEWLVLHTNAPHENLVRDFVSHHFTQVVDFCSLCAIQRQLPMEWRQITLAKSDFAKKNPQFRIVIHPGRHWPIKTFPQEWWNKVIEGVADAYPGQIAIVGKDVDKNTGTVDVDIPPGVTDLRNKLSLLDLSSVLQDADVVVTNDSSPMHIAAAGSPHILFIASCKEPEYLMHWRRDQLGEMTFGWRMENLGLDGLWNHQSSIPIRDTNFTIDVCPPGLMEKILPLPHSVVSKVMDKMGDYC